jgi:branched-chain amino acid transport system substrate-binding protein
MGRRRSVLGLVLVLAMVAAGCANRDNGGTGAEGKVVKIGFIAPIEGPLAPLGRGMMNAAQLAVDQANEAGRIEGWNIEFVPLDDTGNAQKGQNAAARLAGDGDVAAVIGTLNSSVAEAVAPLLAQSDLAMVSPANTNPKLTMGLDWATQPARVYPNYFRVVCTDREQGAFAAKYAYDDLGKRRVVAIHDKKTYGQGLATIFTEEFRKAGGTVVETIEINPGEGDYRTAVTRAKGRNPDMIFYGGEFPEAAVLAKNMAQLDLKAPEVVLMGGDGIVDQTFITNAGGEAAEGHYATNVGATAELLPASKTFVDDYTAAGFKEPYSAYGPQSYDAANVVIAALAEVLEGKDAVDASVRKEVISALQGVSYDGVLGTTSFNEFGDTNNRLLTVLRVEGGSFKALTSRKI